MPLRQLTPFVEALPHVTASAAFRQAEAIAVGTGAMKKGDRSSVTSRWKRDLRTRRGRVRRARTPADLAAAARAAGIGFVRVVPPSDTAPAGDGSRPSSEP